MLEQARSDRQIDFEDSLQAAEDLMALWKGFADVELKFGVRQRLSDEELDAKVRHGTRIFLRAYGV